jgi:dTDP-4-dehydrorhamnose 3,5-epimerase
MNFISTPLTGSFIIEPAPFTDERGWFARYYCEREFEAIGHDKHWVQMNHSVTYQKGALRGMHYQVDPHKEIKMVKCIAGAVFDVIIDIREGSDTFMQWHGEELSATNRRMFYIPEGFAHGFQCLTDHCELLYHHSEFYKSGYEGGIRYNDPRIGIKWPLEVTTISSRDQQHPFLDEKFKGV